MFFAKVSSEAMLDFDPDEISDAQWFSTEEVVEACITGTMKSALTVVAVLRARLKNLI
jgi:NADH pyrophosphatase NudC (nudix superfamily)